MSTSHETYILFGVKLDPKEIELSLSELSDKLEPIDHDRKVPVSKAPVVEAIVDGMSGKYVFVGYIHARSEAYEGFEVPQQIPDQSLDARDALHDNLCGVLSSLGIELDRSIKSRWHVFTHYH